MNSDGCGISKDGLIVGRRLTLSAGIANPKPSRCEYTANSVDHGRASPPELKWNLKDVAEEEGNFSASGCRDEWNTEAMNDSGIVISAGDRK